MKLQGIIFDVDGTIADTEDIHRQAFNKAFVEHGLDLQWSKEKYRQLLFISGGKERIEKCLLEDKTPCKNIEFIEELHRCKSEHYRSILVKSKIKLRPGIQRLISEAKENNIKLGIATNSSTENFTTLIKETLGIKPRELFDTIVTSDIIPNKKPSPEVYYRALKDLKLPANRCIAIEDTANGNDSAIQTGLQTIITTHAYTVDNNFNGASLVLNNLGDPNDEFQVDEKYRCKEKYVDIELLNTIITNKKNFYESKNIRGLVNKHGLS